MFTVQLPPAVFESPPLFSAHWLGRHPHDHLPRVVECLGPSVRDDRAAVHTSALGLKSLLSGKSPTLSRVYAELDGGHLVLYSRGRQFLKTGPLPTALATVLQWRAEVLLVWVDIPLRDPQTQLTRVGLHHVWTGIAPVDGGDPGIGALPRPGVADGWMSIARPAHQEQTAPYTVETSLAAFARPPT